MKHRIVTLFVPALAVIAIALACLSTGARSGGLTLYQIGGVLRDYPSGWDLIRTGGHVPTGLGSVSCPGAIIHVTISPVASAVNSVMASADETYVQNDMITGTWLTNSEMGIRMENARTGATIRCDDPSLIDSTANIWITGAVWR